MGRMGGDFVWGDLELGVGNWELGIGSWDEADEARALT